MYRERLVCPAEEGGDGEPWDFRTLTSIWHLAATLGAPKLQNAVVDEVFVMACRESHDINLALVFSYPQHFGSNIYKALIACAASMPDFTFSDHDNIQTRVWRDMFSELSRQNIQLKAGEQALSQASDFYVPIAE